MNWLLDRLKEKSTWTGIAMILVSMGFTGWAQVAEHVGVIAALVLGGGLIAAKTK